MRGVLIELANVAGRIAREHFAHIGLKDAIVKADRDYVSHVDRKIEGELIARIRARFPDHRVLGEEGGGDALGELGDGPCWIIDPIDGTANFLHGIPAFAISIAYCDAKVDPRHAIVHDPIRQESFIAERGAGVWLNDRRVWTSGCADLSKALIATGLPFRVIEPLDDALRVFADLQRRCEDHRRAGSAALDLAYVAVGRLDAYWELGIHPWDTAAGELLVRCGGGAATDFRGDAGGLAGRRSMVAAATPALQREILAAMGPLVPWLDRAPYRPRA
ncbi:MAG TPA: inositol monophosphatase family protein [Planctomycetota bacterium]|nr:inositol monophosphatase family protein [Planctomycetota bacterium]